MQQARRALLVGLLAVLAGVLAVGCGGGSSEDEGATETGTTVAESPPSTPLDDLADRLQAAGLPAHPSPLREGISEMKVHGVEIVYFADPFKAAKEIVGVTKVATNHPTTALAGSGGRVLVWIADQNGLTSQERATFKEVMQVVDNP